MSWSAALPDWRKTLNRFERRVKRLEKATGGDSGGFVMVTIFHGEERAVAVARYKREQDISDDEWNRLEETRLIVFLTDFSEPNVQRNGSAEAD